MTLDLLAFFADPNGRRSYRITDQPPFSHYPEQERKRVSAHLREMHAVGLLEKASDKRGAVYRATVEGLTVLVLHRPQFKPLLAERINQA